MIDAELCEYVLKRVNPKLIQSIAKIPRNNREDVAQDLKLKVCSSLSKVSYSQTPDFF